MSTGDFVITAPGIQTILEPDWPTRKECYLPEPLPGLGYECLKNSKDKYMVIGFFMSEMLRHVSGLTHRQAGDALAGAFAWATGQPQKKARWPR